MSSSLQTICGNQVIQLGRPLIVGIRIEGTIASQHRSAQHLAARPYVQYLAQTLERLRCDVTLVVSSNPHSEGPMLRHFAARSFPVGFSVLHELPNVGEKNSHGKSVARNHARYFRDRAIAHGVSEDRVLFIDSEINYRYTPMQTLVLEAYQTKSERRRRLQQQQSDAMPANIFLHSGLGGASRQERSAEELAMKPQHQRAWRREQHLQESLKRVNAHSDFLRWEAHSGEESEAAQQHAAKRGWLGRHDARSRPVTVPNQGRRGDERIAVSQPQPHALVLSQQTSSSGSSMVPSALAIQQEDYTLVAVAELVAGLAASEDPVRQYLTQEPLVESLLVPFHGRAHYLPAENCDHIDAIDWSQVVVKDSAQENSIPDVEEGEAHKDLFK